MSSLQKLQNWYLSECNGDWEHSFGVHIETLDNPGWLIKIDLEETSLLGKEFKEHSYGLEAEDEHPEWVHCKVDGGKFIGGGGPLKLEEIIDIFLAWARA